MKKHTPGPWIATPIDVSDFGGRRIADVSDEVFTYDENKANARLIAAAPEMLEMLQQCVSVLFVESQLSNSNDIKHMAIEIKELIAKAIK